ncbi:hypothetical protein [uncultured Dokdonia sp.]|uniref:hypothetical protein n=1 Tax=uncultured Dokdonia sp. TaxID=575653 RepID=UPI002635AB5D|nr:hypothetical protein [uncultured Dokdonia sp.]
MAIRKKWAVPMDSYSKMIIWLNNGNITTFYSLDWKSSHSHLKDRATRLQRFKNKIAQYIPKAREIKIYDLVSERLIAHYESD